MTIEYIKSEFEGIKETLRPFAVVIVRDTDLVSIDTFLKISQPPGPNNNLPMTIGILLKPGSLLGEEQTKGKRRGEDMVLISSIIRENQLVNANSAQRYSSSSGCISLFFDRKEAQSSQASAAQSTT